MRSSRELMLSSRTVHPGESTFSPAKIALDGPEPRDHGRTVFAAQAVGKSAPAALATRCKPARRPTRAGLSG